jgi:hypothetical protein
MPQAMTDVVASTAPRNRDPIFDAIANFEAANERWLAALAWWSEKDARAAAQEFDAADDALAEAEHRMMCMTRPTTKAGAVAWLECVAEFDCPTLFWEGSRDEMREQFVSLLEHVGKLIKVAQ